MRQMYWDVIHEEQKRLKKAHPNMPGKEILKLARAACLETSKTDFDVCLGLAKSM